MKRLFENETFILSTIIIGVLAVFLGIYYLVYRIDKYNCENKGGTYIWEINSHGNKCHLGD